MHISSDKAFCKTLKKPSIVQNFFLPHMKAFSLAIEKKQKKNFFEKPNNQKPKIKNLNKSHFQGFTNIQFFILEQFLQFKACKSVKIDTIAIEVAQQIKSSGCPTKGYFTTKSAKNAFLVVRWPFVGQPDDVIC